MGVADKGVGEAEELSEDREGGSRIGLELEGEIDALAGLSVVEAEVRVSMLVRFFLGGEGGGAAYVLGWSRG